LTNSNHTACNTISRITVIKKSKRIFIKQKIISIFTLLFCWVYYQLNQDHLHVREVQELDRYTNPKQTKIVKYFYTESTYTISSNQWSFRYIKKYSCITYIITHNISEISPMSFHASFTTMLTKKKPRKSFNKLNWIQSTCFPYGLKWPPALWHALVRSPCSWTCKPNRLFGLRLKIIPSTAIGAPI
jgi:hypothetical protein